MARFKDKTVLITGAGRGIGQQTAIDFAAEGANVCINYAHSAVGAQRTADAITAEGGHALTVQANIAVADEVKAMVERCIETFGSIDILVNNAGLSIDGPFLEMHEEDWDRVYEVNLKGPFLVSQAVARQMMTGAGGVIVNLSATTTINGRPNAANYLATKAGLNMLTKCMALELGPEVRVNGIGLGFVESPLIHELYSSEQLELVLEGTPMARMTTPKETSAFVRLLASEETAFVTGQTIMFDGGRVMR